MATYYDKVKERVTLNHGQQDGLDDIRWEAACNMSCVTDNLVETCFTAIVSLEKKGLIEIKNIGSD